ncbi:sensor histidine kinase [Pedobacter metabolipauper]|uniref:histidine kinase n=1 Tax=Pedobacter metabolipauper TaxID=425513 RepID=A0A4R6SQE8_9SPHI|nr:histidine kinase [Pedobacter metabolipauper]TDQ06402.1 signal transduction histidine kinase [Pedobacter metabolipauper]
MIDKYIYIGLAIYLCSVYYEKTLLLFFRSILSFEIIPFNDQTEVPKLFTVIALTGLILLLTLYSLHLLKKFKLKLRLRIKYEEQFKIRKQTAEDFHDDLGNKLTRITILSEVLKSMIDENDTKKRTILKQISQNVDELFTCTKDILWSLNPKNDTLNQLLDHLEEFAIEMFEETEVQFKSEMNTNQMHAVLSLNLSRNMLMIFKEAIHNALKHAKANEVTFKTKLINNLVLISLRDNGIGFNTTHVKNGHGINNMYVRAKRIHADLAITSNCNGTQITLTLPFSSLKNL